MGRTVAGSSASCRMGLSLPWTAAGRQDRGPVCLGRLHADYQLEKYHLSNGAGSKDWDGTSGRGTRECILGKCGWTRRHSCRKLSNFRRPSRSSFRIRPSDSKTREHSNSARTSLAKCGNDARSFSVSCSVLAVPDTEPPTGRDGLLGNFQSCLDASETRDTPKIRISNAKMGPSSLSGFDVST